MNPEDAMRALRDMEVATFYLMVKTFKADSNEFLTKMAQIAPMARLLHISDDMALSIMHRIHDDPSVSELAKVISGCKDAYSVSDPNPDDFADLPRNAPPTLYDSAPVSTRQIMRVPLDIPEWRNLDLSFLESVTGSRECQLLRFLRSITGRKFRNKKSDMTISRLREIRKDLLRELKLVVGAGKT